MPFFAPLVVPAAVMTARVAMSVYRFAAPLVVRGASAAAPVAKSAAQSVAAAAPGALATAGSVAGRAGGAVVGAAKSVGGAVVGAGASAVKGAPGFLMDVGKSAVGMGVGAAASTSLGGRAAGMAASSLGSLLKTGGMIYMIYEVAKFLRGQLSEKFFGKDILEGKKPLTPEEQAAAGANAAQRDGSVKMTMTKDGVPRTVNVPSLPGETDEAALTRTKGWWDKQAAEGKLPPAGEGLSVQVGSGQTYALGKDGQFQKVQGAPGDLGSPFADARGNDNMLGRLMGGNAGVRSTDVVTDPVRVGAVTSLVGAADGGPRDGKLPVSINEIKGASFSAVSIVPQGDSLADRKAQGVTSVVVSTDPKLNDAVTPARGQVTSLIHSKTITDGAASVDRTVWAHAGKSAMLDKDGRIDFKQDGAAAKAVSQNAQMVGRVGQGTDSLTEAMTSSGRPLKGEVMLSPQTRMALSKFETVGPDGVKARGAIAISEGRADMVVLGSDGKTPVATHTMKDSGFAFDKDGKPSFSGQAQESLRSFASDPRGQMRETVGMTRDDGALKALMTPSASERGSAMPALARGKASMEM